MEEVLRIEIMAQNQDILTITMINQENRDKVNSSIRITRNLIKEIAVDMKSEAPMNNNHIEEDLKASEVEIEVVILEGEGEGIREEEREDFTRITLVTKKWGVRVGTDFIILKRILLIDIQGIITIIKISVHKIIHILVISEKIEIMVTIAHTIHSRI